MNEAYNIDCMEFMRRVPSKYFDLAVVDPPYGIEKGFKETSRVRRYGQTKTANDDKPTAEYFTELFRVSKNQIIWGYNHLSDLPKTLNVTGLTVLPHPIVTMMYPPCGGNGRIKKPPTFSQNVGGACLGKDKVTHTLYIISRSGAICKRKAAGNRYFRACMG